MQIWFRSVINNGIHTTCVGWTLTSYDFLRRGRESPLPVKQLAQTLVLIVFVSSSPSEFWSQQKRSEKLLTGLGVQFCKEQKILIRRLLLEPHWQWFYWDEQYIHTELQDQKIKCVFQNYIHGWRSSVSLFRNYVSRITKVKL